MYAESPNSARLPTYVCFSSLRTLHVSLFLSCPAKYAAPLRVQHEPMTPALACILSADSGTAHHPTIPSYLPPSLAPPNFPSTAHAPKFTHKHPSFPPSSSLLSTSLPYNDINFQTFKTPK